MRRSNWSSSGRPPSPSCRPVTDRTPVETADRLTRVRLALEHARAERAVGPSLVTLQGEFPVAELLKELSRQTGNSIVDRRAGQAGATIESDPLLTVDFHDKAFWQAFDEVLDRLNLDVDSYAGGEGLAVVPRPMGRLPRVERASYAGPIRVEPVRFEAVADLRRPDNRSLKLLLEVEWEPRLQPILITQSLERIEATAGGKPLLVDGRGDLSAPVGEGPSAVSIEIPLKMPPRATGAIDVFEGQLKMMVPADVEVFRFQPPTVKAGGGRKAQLHKGAVTVTLESVRKSGDAWELEVSAQFDDPTIAIDSYLIGWLLDNKVTLEHDGRAAIAPVATQQTRQTRNEVGVKYRFALPEGLDGWSLVYHSPTAVLEVPAKYRFTNLDLP